MSALLDLNIALFRVLGAGHQPDARLLWFAGGIAEDSAWLCVALLGWAAWRQPAQRFYLLGTLLAAAAASLLAHVLAEAIGMPRPFVMGLSPAHIEHGVRGSLPSAHATVMFTVGLVFCLRAAQSTVPPLKLGARTHDANPRDPLTSGAFVVPGTVGAESRAGNGGRMVRRESGGA
jgi:membrane-associated phospholipid phosphatase